MFKIADTVHAMVLLMWHTHYTLTQPESLGLIDNKWLNKNLKQMLWMYTVFSMQNSMENRRDGRLLC